MRTIIIEFITLVCAISISLCFFSSCESLNPSIYLVLVVVTLPHSLVRKHFQERSDLIKSLTN